MIFALFRRSANARLIERLHGEIMAGVRQPALYVEYGVADTFDGRFELLVLLMVLFVRRLARMPAPGPDIAQELTDQMFAELDAAMREMGVGDLAVPKRIKKQAAAFLGRRNAYDGALDAEGMDELQAALARNVYGEAPEGVASAHAAVRLARYVRAVDAALAGQSIEAIVRGPVALPAAADIA